MNWDGKKRPVFDWRARCEDIIKVVHVNWYKYKVWLCSTMFYCDKCSRDAG